MGAKTKVLITVKTYPWPHPKYREVVCSAGVLQTGAFIRLFPVPFRYISIGERFKKYQWIQVELEKSHSDPRPDTFVPKSKIELLGKPLSTRDGWRQRKDIVLAKEPSVMCELEKQRRPKHTLGIIRVRSVLNIRGILIPGAADWNPDIRSLLEQQDLFTGAPKKLMRIPYGFICKFRCSDVDCKGHEKRILDWEVGALYLKELARFDQRGAADSVVARLKRVCSEDHDLFFFVGTLLGQPKPTWSIMGLFNPPKRDQTFSLVP